MGEMESISILVVPSPDVPSLKMGDLTIIGKKWPVHFVMTSGLTDALDRVETLEGLNAVIFCFPSDEETGRNTLRRLRNNCPTLPVIVLSAQNDVRVAVAAVKDGAQNYILRGRDENSEILLSLISVVEHTLILSDWKSAVDRAFHRASRDPLTELPNRSLLQNHLATALSEAKKQDEILAVLFVDLDHFKQVNDRMGHDVGDRVLQEAAKRLIVSMRSGEFIARYGGDEFVAVLRHLSDPKDATRVAERINAGLQRLAKDMNLSVPLAASIGISLFPYDGEYAETLIVRADEALLRAKRLGRGEIIFASDKSTWSQAPGANCVTALSKRVLIVDDEDSMRELLKEILTGEGYMVLEAASVDEAFNLLTGNSPDLILLDLGFQRESGLSLLERIIQAGLPAPPVIIISGHSDPEIVKFAMTLGACDFIAKPFSNSEVVRKLHSLLH